MVNPEPCLADKAIRWASTLSVIVLAGIAALISYRHMFQLVLRYEQSSWTAALLPISVDGMIAVASMSLLVDSRMGRRSGLLPWTLLVLGSAASLAANVAVAEPSVVGRLIAAWPSTALIGSYELLMRQVRNASQQGASATPDEVHTASLNRENGSYVPSYETAIATMDSYAHRLGPLSDEAVSYEAHTRLDSELADGADEIQTESRQQPADGGGEQAAGDQQAESARSGARRPTSMLQRRAWQWALANRTSNGELPSGRAIAQEFDRRERWGRLVKQAGLAGRLDSVRAQ